jgi:hypothetical protein
MHRCEHDYLRSYRSILCFGLVWPYHCCNLGMGGTGMTKDEALDLALRSLKELVPDESDYAPAIQGQRKRQEKAITAIKQARSAPVQEPVDILIEAWQALEETSGHVLDVGDVEGRMHMSVIRNAWEQMDSLVREMWDERGRP